MIRAEHITKSFDGRVVLDDISIEFETGRTNLIIGRDVYTRQDCHSVSVP